MPISKSWATGLRLAANVSAATREAWLTSEPMRAKASQLKAAAARTTGAGEQLSFTPQNDG